MSMGSKILGSFLAGAVIAYLINALALAVYAVICTVIYLSSLRTHPNRACPRCDGGKNAALFFVYAHGQCQYCGGSGRQRRLGVRVTGIGSHRPR